MIFQTLGLWALLAVAVSAKICYNMTLPIPVTARNAVFDGLETPKTNLDVTRFILASIQQGANFTDKALTGYKTVSGHYNISAQYCMPNSCGESSPKLQILTHGVGFDKTYWDLPYNDFNYSYVDYSLSRGYHTLAYDRLGTGNSSHGEPKNEIQSFLEIESLAQITSMIRNGSIPRLPKPSKIFHVGHSFGSMQTYVMTNKYPNHSDGIVLTGFSLNSTFSSIFLAGGNYQQMRLNHAASPKAFKQPGQNYSLGYLTSADVGNNQFQFFHPPNFDPKILAFAEMTKQPVTVGEFLTIASAPPESSFAGPVMMIAGSNDVPFCGGDCLATGGTTASIPAAAKKAFPSAKSFDAFIQPNTGHGLNLHYNATAGYKQITDFLDRQG